MVMKKIQQDFSILEKLELERAPVGIKYEFFKPEGIEQLNKALALCEMVKEAQQREKPFYITEDNEDCAGKGALGMMVAPAWAEAGEIGVRMEVFQNARANLRCMEHYGVIKHGIVNYVVFSRLDQMTFEPDLLVFVAPPEKAELILRAMSYSTGEMYESKATPIFQCSWLYTYPYVTGKVNYVMTGLGFGMRAREVFPPGLAIVSVPWTWIPTILANLKEMKWELPAWTYGRERWLKEESATLAKLHQESKDAGLIKDKDK